MGQDILQEGSGDKNKIIDFISRNRIKKADFVVAKSKYIMDKLLLWGIPNEKVKLNYWGIDLNYFKPGDKSNARKKLGLPNDKKIILSPRSFAEHYNLHLIAESFVKSLETLPDCEIIFLGRASDQKYIERIKNILAEKNCLDKAHFIFNISQNEILDYYHSADLALSISRTDGFPSALFELMACRVPVIAGNIPHLNELLTDKKNVFLNDLTVQSLTEKINWAFDPGNKTILNDIVEKGYQTVHKYGDIQKNSLEFMKNISALNHIHKRSSYFSSIIFVVIDKIITSLIHRKKRIY